MLYPKTTEYIQALSGSRLNVTIPRDHIISSEGTWILLRSAPPMFQPAKPQRLTNRKPITDS
jgi:hypothetical protein